MNSQTTCTEMEVLLCCARVHLHEKTLERMDVLVQQSIDWQSLIRTMLRHEVEPLVYTNLRGICWEAIPGNSRAELERNFLANVQNSFFLTAELLKLVNL